MRTHGTDLGTVAVVLPSRRAGLHLQKYLAQRTKGALWSPEILDPGAFISRIAGIEPADPLELLLRLYRVNRQLRGNEAESLDEFLQWAPTLLRDMSEIDAHQLDPAVVYRDLRQYHELDAWSFLGTDPLSAGQLRTIEQWRRMGELHARFGIELSDAGLGMSGSIARTAAEKVRDQSWESPWQGIWVAGLNAIEPALTQVIKALQVKGLARIAWDADVMYLDDEENEAARFLRRSILRLGTGVIPAGNRIVENQRAINSVAVSDSAGLIRHATDWVSELGPDQREDAVILLADEGLLLPLLENLPKELGPINVTMGIPLRALPAHGLETCFMEFHREAMGKPAWRTDAIRTILSHPMLHEGGPTRELLRSLRQPFMNFEDLRLAVAGSSSGFSDHVLNALSPIAEARDLPERLRRLLSWAAQVQKKDTIAHEQLFQLAKSGRILDSMLDAQADILHTFEAYASLRERVSRDARLNLFGEPLAGLQVMGLLESRALDHRFVLVLGANEGTLGGGDPPSSWIPYDLRRHYGLPLHTDADAVVSYHMHRLLHHAEHVDLAYVTSGGQDTSPSRFIAQWNHAFAKGTRTVRRSLARSAPAISRPRPVIAVQKSAAIMEKLKTRVAKGLSPSALGTWLTCPLDFHTRYILGIRDEDEDPDRLAAHVLGEALHAVMEGILRPTIGNRIDASALRSALNHLDAALRDRFLDLGITDKMLSTGHHRLVASMGASAMKRYLESEALRCAREETIILGLEETVAAEVAPNYRITGKFDRMEQRDGLLHLLDLKTGRVEDRLLNLESFDRSSITRKHGQALQLICYAVMAFERNPDLQEMKAGIIPLRTPSAYGGAWLRVGAQDRLLRSDLGSMRALIVSIVEEILDQSVPFRHDKDSSYCSTCID